MLQIVIAFLILGFPIGLVIGFRVLKAEQDKQQRQDDAWVRMMREWGAEINRGKLAD